MNCMKCGREIPDGGSVFCPACAAGPSAVTEGAVERSERKSILWIEQKLEQPAEKKKILKKRTASLRRRVRVLAVALALAVALLGGACFLLWSEHERCLGFEAQQEDLRVREANLILRERTASALESQNEDLEEALSQARAANQTQEATIQKLEEQNITEVTQRDNRIHTLEEELSRTTAERDGLAVSSAEQSAAQNERISALSSANAALQERVGAAESEVAWWRAEMVFWQPGTWRYHYFGCPELDLTQSFDVYTQEDAVISAGLLPCEICAAADPRR